MQTFVTNPAPGQWLGATNAASEDETLAQEVQNLFRGASPKAIKDALGRSRLVELQSLLSPKVNSQGESDRRVAALLVNVVRAATGRAVSVDDLLANARRISSGSGAPANPYADHNPNDFLRD